jgi:hypothetical protein
MIFLKKKTQDEPHTNQTSSINVNRVEKTVEQGDERKNMVIFFYKTKANRMQNASFFKK